MACGCIGRQRKLVKWLCARGMTKLCQRAMRRLENMERKENAKAGSIQSP